MAELLTARERALRAIPLPYSLALRLRDAGVAPGVVCEYVDVDESSLEGLYRLAEAKFVAAQLRLSPRDGERRSRQREPLGSREQTVDEDR